MVVVRVGGGGCGGALTPPIAAESKVEAAATGAPVPKTPLPHIVEHATHSVQRYARRELGSMFVGAPKTAIADLKLITIAFQTRADMATWSADIVEEREQLQEEVWVPRCVCVCGG